MKRISIQIPFLYHFVKMKKLVKIILIRGNKTKEETHELLICMCTIFHGLYTYSFCVYIRSMCTMLFIIKLHSETVENLCTFSVLLIQRPNIKFVYVSHLEA